MRVPDPDTLAAQPLLAPVVILDRALLIFARTVHAHHSDVDRVPRPADPPLIASARDLLDACDLAHHGLRRYRDTLLAALHAPDARERGCPF